MVRIFDGLDGGGNSCDKKWGRRPQNTVSVVGPQVMEMSKYSTNSNKYWPTHVKWRTEII
jgi:hypothetical protein